MAGDENNNADDVTLSWFKRAFIGAIAFAIAAYLVVHFW